MSLIEVIPDEILVAVCSRWLSLVDLCRLDRAATSHRTRDIMLDVFKRTEIDTNAFNHVMKYFGSEYRPRHVSFTQLLFFCDWVMCRKFPARGQGLTTHVNFGSIPWHSIAQALPVSKAAKGEGVSEDATASDEDYNFVHHLQTNWLNRPFQEESKLNFISSRFSCLKELTLHDTVVSDDLFNTLGKFVPARLPHLTRISCNKLELSETYVEKSEAVLSVLGPRMVNIKNRSNGDRAYLQYLSNLEYFQVDESEEYELLPHMPNLLRLLLTDESLGTSSATLKDLLLPFVLQLLKVHEISFGLNFPVHLLQHLLAEMPQVTTFFHKLICIDRTDANDFFVSFRDSPNFYGHLSTAAWNAMVATLPPIRSLRLADDSACLSVKFGSLVPHQQHIRSVALSSRVVMEHPSILHYILTESSKLEKVNFGCFSFQDAFSGHIHKKERDIFFSFLFPHAAHLKTLLIEGIGFLSEKEVQQIVSKCPVLVEFGFRMTKRSSPDAVLKTLASKGTVWKKLAMDFLGPDEVASGVVRFGLQVMELRCRDISVDYSAYSQSTVQYGFGTQLISAEFLENKAAKLRAVKQEKAARTLEIKNQHAEKKAQKLAAKEKRAKEAEKKKKT
eukprot:gene34478-41741_t